MAERDIKLIIPPFNLSDPADLKIKKKLPYKNVTLKSKGKIIIPDPISMKSISESMAEKDKTPTKLLYSTPRDDSVPELHEISEIPMVPIVPIVSSVSTSCQIIISLKNYKILQQKISDNKKNLKDKAKQNIRMLESENEIRNKKLSSLEISYKLDEPNDVFFNNTVKETIMLYTQRIRQDISVKIKNELDRKKYQILITYNKNKKICELNIPAKKLDVNDITITKLDFNNDKLFFIIGNDKDKIYETKYENLCIDQKGGYGEDIPM